MGILDQFDAASDPAIETVADPYAQSPEPAQNAKKPLWATVLAEPFSGTVAQGVCLLLAKDFS